MKNQLMSGAAALAIMAATPAFADQGTIVRTHWGTALQCFSFDLQSSLPNQQGVQVSPGVYRYGLSLLSPVLPFTLSEILVGEAEQIANNIGKSVGMNVGGTIGCSGEDLPTFADLNMPPDQDQ